MDEEEGLFRMYLSDIGMFLYQSGVNQMDFFIKERRNTLSGIFFENYVACELVSKEIPLYYWVGKNEHEFEFIVQNDNHIIPIDVKRKNGKLNSLESFRNSNEKYTAIKISQNNYGYDKEKEILTIPLYEVFMLADDIKNNKKII